MERSAETLLRWTCITWLWVFAVLAGLGAGQMVKKWPESTGWHAPSQLADGSASGCIWGSHNQSRLNVTVCVQMLLTLFALNSQNARHD